MTKNLAHSTIAKVSAIFLITIDMIVVAVFSLGILYMLHAGFYITSFNDIKDDLVSDIAYDYVYQVYTEYTYGINPTDRFENSNFSFVITDLDGTELLSTHLEDFSSELPTVRVDYSEYIVYGYIDETFPNNDKAATVVRLASHVYSLRYAAIIIDVIAAIIFFILLVFLYFSAGYRSGRDTPALPALGKIPFDVLTFIIFCIALLELSYLSSVNSTYLLIISSAILLVADFVIFLLYTMNFAIRIKLNNLISDSVLYKILSWFFNFLKNIYELGIHIISRLPLVWKTVCLFIAVLIFEFIMMNIFYSRAEMAAMWFFKKLICFPILIFVALSLRNMQKGAQQIADGNLDYQIDTKFMFGDFKKSAEDLNSINIGMQKAVDEKMRSERLKTELITNVSHDIKTPLTSIINYVDLIKKEHIANEHVTEYINVLDRQSVRLKKLIEDLVEASKASTGNLPVNLAPCDVGVLLDQAIAEYDDKLKAADLELILNKTLFPVFIMADGRHLWRIFDNLLNNICKYTQAFTRVYIDLQVIGSDAVIIFRNISKYPLNISSDELVERFVRGDSSRNTEGSGLGLSIAKSLADLQNGILDLMVDGDLFKVSLKFKTMEGR